MLLRETEATILIPPPGTSGRSVGSQLESQAESDRIIVSGTTGRRFSGLFEGTYEWTIEEESAEQFSRERVLKERIEVPDALVLVFAVSVVGAMLLWTVFFNPIAATVLLVGCVGFYAVLPFLYPTQILSLEECDYQETYTASTVPRFFLAIAGFSWAFPVVLYGVPFYTNAGSIIGVPIERLLTVAGLAIFSIGMFAIGSDLSVQRFGMVTRVRSIPIHAAMLTGGYALFFAIAAIPLVIFSSDVFFEIQVTSYALRLTMLYFTSVFIVLFGALYFVTWHLGPNQQYLANTGLAGLQSDRKPVERGFPRIWQTVRKTITIGLTLSVSILVYLSLQLYWNRFDTQLFIPLWNRNFYPIFDDPVLTLLGVVIALPIAYFFAGFVYQVGTHLWVMTRFVRESEHAHTFGENPGIEVRRLPAPFNRPTAVSIFWYNFIGVPGEILDNRGTEALTEEEYIALLEHELAHLDHGDAILSFLIKLLSPSLFIGCNVIYAVFDFRQRELDADAAVTNKQALYSLLKKSLFTDGAGIVDESDTFEKATASEEPTASMPQLRPSLPGATASPTINATLQRFFQPYFGDFAMTSAHPSPLERMAKLEESFSEESPSSED